MVFVTAKQLLSPSSSYTISTPPAIHSGRSRTQSQLLLTTHPELPSPSAAPFSTTPSLCPVKPMPSLPRSHRSIVSTTIAADLTPCCLIPCNRRTKAKDLFNTLLDAVDRTHGCMISVICGNSISSIVGRLQETGTKRDHGSRVLPTASPSSRNSISPVRRAVSRRRKTQPHLIRSLRLL